MGDLPSVYANKIDKDIKNNEEYYYGVRQSKEVKNVKDLRKYFDKNGYANKLQVMIKTKNGKTDEKLILYKDNYFININNQKIYFKDIIDYEVK